MKNIVFVESKNFVSTTPEGIKTYNVVDKTTKYFAYEDVDLLIFDNFNSYLSQRLVSRALEHNIVLLFTDQKHSPAALYENIYGQVRRLQVLQNQLAISSKTKGRIWYKIVVQKIKNQSLCLKELGYPEEQVGLVKSAINNVTEGDKHNVEAYAASVYFDDLFGTDFKRGRYPDPINTSLNYGYGVLRMLIRREIVVHGMEPSWGVNHASTENPFNLSDDLIECFRPLIDLWLIRNILNEPHEELTVDDRKKIVSFLLEKCLIDKKVYRVRDAIKICVDSYLRCLEHNSASDLKLPTFIEGGR